MNEEKLEQLFTDVALTKQNVIDIKSVVDGFIVDRKEDEKRITKVEKCQAVTEQKISTLTWFATIFSTISAGIGGAIAYLMARR